MRWWATPTDTLTNLNNRGITNRRVVDRRALLSFFCGLWRQLTVARVLLRECTTTRMQPVVLLAEAPRAKSREE